MSQQERSEWYAAVLEEYRSLRSEAVAAREAQLSVLRLVIPLIGAAIALGLNLDDNAASGVIFSIVIPVTVIISFELWISEIYRTMRSGAVVAAIEQRLAELFQDLDLGAPIGWEGWLRDVQRAGGGKGRMSRQTRGTVRRGLIIYTTLYLVAVGSIGYGVYLVAQSSRLGAFAVAAVDVLGVAFFLYQALFSVRNLAQVANPPSRDELWAGSA